jgi:hypothetical protein
MTRCTVHLESKLQAPESFPPGRERTVSVTFTVETSMLMPVLLPNGARIKMRVTEASFPRVLKQMGALP